MMNLPQLPPEPMRPEEEKPEGKEVFYPSWQCFCCQDTGKVQPHLVRHVIPAYNYDRDRLPVCQNLGCKKGANFFHLQGCIDMRLTAEICQELDRINREDWRQTQERRLIDIKSLSQKRAMPGSSERTENDNRKVQLQKAEIEAITHDQWIAMSDAYFGGDTP